MNIEHLKLFTNLAETHNFSLTAKLTNRTQSGVSQAIKSLENELGFRLFFRDNKDVILTSSGKIFYSRIRVLLNNLDSIINESKNLADTTAGTIRIGIVGTPFENQLIPELLGRFHQKHPEINIEVEHLNNLRLKQHLTTRQCDLIFISDDDAATIKGSQFYPLISGEFVAVIPMSNPLSDLPEIKISDLARERVFLMSRSWSSEKQNDLNFQIVKDLSDLDSNNVNVVMAANMMTEAQLGIMITSSLICAPHYQNCVITPLAYPAKLSYGICKLKSYRSPFVEEFINEVSQMDCQDMLN